MQCSSSRKRHPRAAAPAPDFGQGQRHSAATEGAPQMLGWVPTALLLAVSASCLPKTAASIAAAASATSPGAGAPNVRVSPAIRSAESIRARQAAAGRAIGAVPYPPAQLRKTASCLAAGLDPQLVPYRQALPLPDTYAKGKDHAAFAPLFASASLNPNSRPNLKVQQAVVFIHGAAGDANVYFCDGYAAAKTATGSAGSVLVIAPWFGNTQVSAIEWTGQPVVGANLSAFYASGHGGVGWLGGGDNTGAPVPSTTSFDVLDCIVNALGAARAEGRFPNLQRVVINGFSAGGQMVSRWAVFSPPEFYGALPVRVIAADGSSYMYLDAKRPVSSCSSLRDTGVNHTCHMFAVPTDQNVTAPCAGYDQYKYGLQVTAAARSSMYLARFADNPDKLGSAISVRAD